MPWLLLWYLNMHECLCPYEKDIEYEGHVFPFICYIEAQ